MWGLGRTVPGKRAGWILVQVHEPMKNRDHGSANRSRNLTVQAAIFLRPDPEPVGPFFGHAPIIAAAARKS